MLLAGTGVGVALGGGSRQAFGWRVGARRDRGASPVCSSPSSCSASASRAGHGRPDGRDRRRRDRARRRGRARRPVRARLPAVRARHDRRPPRRHADDHEHPHDALRARRRRRAAVHDHGHRRVAAAVLRAAPPLRRGRRRGACSGSSPCSAACPACSSAAGSPTATRRRSRAAGSPCPPSSCSSAPPASRRRTCSAPIELPRSTGGRRPRLRAAVVGLFVITMAIPGLRAGLTDAIPAHLRGAGFGAFNLVAVVVGMAAAPFIVGALSSALRREPARRLPARVAVHASSAPPCSSGPASSSTRTCRRS